MPKTHPLSIACETHGLAGNLVLPDKVSAEAPAIGAIFPGGPGPAPEQRYTPEGAKRWPVLWSESFGGAGLAALCYDQRGSGLSTGTYHEADFEDLYEDARAAAEMLKVQPEVSKTAAVAWGEGCAFALRLAAEGLVQALVLMAPAYHTEAERYAASIRALAAKKGLSDRVVQVRVGQWQAEMAEIARQVEQGQITAETDLSGTRVTINRKRFLQNAAFDPAQWAAKVKVPALILHGSDDAVILPGESEALAEAWQGPVHRIVYKGQAHFLYRHAPAMRDAAAWLKQTLGA